MKFSRGVLTWREDDNPQSPASRTGLDLVPLAEAGFETRASGLAANLQWTLPSQDAVLVSIIAQFGRRLTDLGPEDYGAKGQPGARTPGGFWPTLLNDIDRAASAVRAQGKTYAVPFWNVDQGEAEATGVLYEGQAPLAATALLAAYTDRALSVARAFDSEARSRTGSSAPVRCLVTPACNNLLTPTAWLGASDSSDLVVVVGPRYQMPSALESMPAELAVHYSPDGQRWIGEMVAKVGAKVMAGERWQPMRALRAAKASAGTIDLTLHVPSGPVRVDREFLPKRPGFGFALYTGSLDAKSERTFADDVQVVSPDTLRLFFGSIPQGAKLEIGGTSDGTNIRDSDPAQSVNNFARGPRVGQPYPLWNWLCQQAGLAIEGA